MLKPNFLILGILYVVVSPIKCESSDESDIDFAEEAKRIIVESCRTPNATDADVEAVINDDDQNLSYERKCIEACILKTLGIMKEDGQFCVQTAISYLEADGMDEDELELKREVIEKCKDSDETDECELAFQFDKCFANGLQELEENK